MKHVENARSFATEYRILLKRFNTLCTGCNDLELRVNDAIWLARMREFVGHVRAFIIPLVHDNAIFATSIRKMVCGRARCQNLPGWPPQLSRDFSIGSLIFRTESVTGLTILGFPD